MSRAARVQSVEALKAFRRALFKFAESANASLTDAESEVNRLMMWLTTEQLSYWQIQIRKRTDLVGRCEEAYRQKKIFVDAAGRRSTAIDELKALEKAKRMLEVAQQKFANTKSWARKLEREAQNYKGTVQRFATTVQSDLPVAAAKIESAVLRLEAYLKLSVPVEAGAAAPAAGSDPMAAAAAIESQPSMARPEPSPDPPVTEDAARPEPSVPAEDGGATGKQVS